MSELTQCNFCSLKDMQDKAKERGVTVIVTLEDDGWTSARYSDENEPSAWFMKLTDDCVC